MSALPDTPSPRLADIRPCLEGAVPAVMATCSTGGMPNVTYISQVFHVDDRHVALSFQFFNKTRQNILANPVANVLVMHPLTAAFFRLHIRYLRTETEGPVFEAMKAQLAGIASHTGMAAVFKLLGSDIYEVEAIECVSGDALPLPPARASRATRLRRASEQVARCTALDELLNTTLNAMTSLLDTRHAMVLLLDAANRRLYTVASTGYAASGVGSEIAVGDGVIGVAARERVPVRIMHVTSAYSYHQAIRQRLAGSKETGGPATETDIPYPGLRAPHSQLAVPMVSAGQLIGVLFAESPEDLHFDFEAEDLMVALAHHVAAAMESLQAGTEPADAPELAADGKAGAANRGSALQVRYFAASSSVFIGDVYLIKGVAGAIFWKLVNDCQQHGRTEFSNRELRLDAAIRLPDVTDNLEARLLLLQRRLAEHGPDVRIEKTGRGRFRLVLTRPLALQALA